MLALQYGNMRIAKQNPVVRFQNISKLQVQLCGCTGCSPVSVRNWASALATQEQKSLLWLHQAWQPDE